MLAAYYFHSSLGGGNIRIETKKVKVEAKSKVGSLNNTTHKPGGGDKKVRLELLSFFPPGCGSGEGLLKILSGVWCSTFHLLSRISPR